MRGRPLEHLSWQDQLISKSSADLAVAGGVGGEGAAPPPRANQTSKAIRLKRHHAIDHHQELHPIASSVKGAQKVLQRPRQPGSALLSQT